MTSLHDPAAAQALDWLARQQDPAFGDWDDFTAWLEADASNAAAYQRLARIDALVAEDLASHPPVAAAPRRRFGAAAALVAATLMAVVGIAGFSIGGNEGEVIVTAATERRHILLGDGSHVILNRGSRIRIDSDRGRAVTLVEGEALFDVEHDPRQRFRVSFSGGQVENLGTRFTVRRTASETDITVIRGAVAYRGEAGGADLRPGERLVAAGKVKRVERIAPDAVGGWASPRLVYDDAPLSRVAADISRELGTPVSVAPEAADQPVSASIQLELGVEESMAKLGPLLDIRVTREGDGWRLSPAR